MKRIIELYLKEWIASEFRKPLILRGARQVGKTYVVRGLCSHFDNLVEVNFEVLREAIPLFEGNLEPEVILQKLSLLMKQPIIPGKTLLFLDEIQEAPRAIIALRYFYEKLPALHVIAAGSLLDFALQEVGVPVGRVQFMALYPMSFIEYLYAKGDVRLAQEILLHSPHEPMNTPIHQHILTLLSEYLALGGMPEVIQQWVKTKSIQTCLSVQKSIIQAYQQDFQKYAKKTQIKYVDLLFQQIPLHLGKQFKFSQLNTPYRKRELEPCLDLLEKAKVLNKVYRTDAQGLPLFSQSDVNIFKIIGLDIGLSQAILGESIDAWFLDPTSALVNKGSLIESFVGQELLAYQPSSGESKLFYWDRQSPSSNAEIDYVWIQNKKIIPIEVKSRYGSSLQSMRQFLTTHPLSPYGIRFSAHDYSQHENIHSYPLYAITNIIEDNTKLKEFLD